MKDYYTGRQIAIFTDAHALYEPTYAILEDMKKKGITEIYSLGDNIGIGPNPNEVLDLLSSYGVKSILGNSEEYCILGSEPFSSYFNYSKEANRKWTISKIGEQNLGNIKLFSHSIELIVGGKKLALCHFANDVRCDFAINSTWTYQNNIRQGLKAYSQFLYTNSSEQLNRINYMIYKYGIDSPFVSGYLSSKEDPLFKGKKVDCFDAIIQGHTHFKFYEDSGKTKFYTIRGVGIAYNEDAVDTASYVIIKEKKRNEGYDYEEVLVHFNRQKMIENIEKEDYPGRDLIEKYTSVKKNK